jgi:hypothetical protein
MGYHGDGRMDCRMSHCSLYPFRPYKDALTSTTEEAVSSEIRPPATHLSKLTPRKRGNGHKAARGGQ